MAATAQVAVSGATVHFDKLYTYLVPEHLRDTLRVGGMVLVPFGRGSARGRMGVVLALDDTPAPDARLKEIYDAAPEKAWLSDELLSLVRYLRDSTFCTYYEAVKAVIPYGAQYKVMDAGGTPRLQKQIIRDTERVYARGVQQKKQTEKQALVWNALADGALSAAELEARGASKNVLARMEKQGALVCAEREKTQELYGDEPPAGAVTLSQKQQEAFETLDALRRLPEARVALLHGVTSSGKTLVFIKLIQAAVAQGKTALVLVPEISLTPQMIRRLKAHFGTRVAVQHSALNHTERLLQWQQIQNGAADVVVGTRSAVFAPLTNMDLIIIDEEQDHAYHSESAPRYSAHEVAKRRAAAHGALLLLASATPSVESYYAAREGRYALVELRERYGATPLPSVELVDMRAELAAGNAGGISSALQSAVEQNLRDKNQTILLLNRRGYKTVGMCTKCSEVIKCDACSVPMVYHKADNRLLCHYCGKAISPVPELCPKCGERVKYTGFGTQRVEEELAEKFPTARVLRMDADSTGRKNAHDTMLRRFAGGKYDILLGTQMVAKGLDFPRVTLVGVLGIDQLLFAQGFKAFENVFSLVTQVVGRGGRAGTQGRAMIQTVDPAHPVLTLAAQQDYVTFYEQEIGFRRLNLYPPFCTICLVAFSGEQDAQVYAAAVAFSRAVQEETRVRGDIPLRVLGPAPMNILMVNNRYRYKLTLKCRNNKAFRAMLTAAFDTYGKLGLASHASVTINFNTDADI